MVQMKKIKRDSFFNFQTLIRVLMIGVFMVFLSSQTIHASDLAKGDYESLEISGLIIEDTMTKAGHDLYEAFNTHWKPIEGLDYTITITEKADSFRGSMFWIKVNDTVVYQGRLNPRPDLIEEVAKNGIARANYFLLQNIIVAQELEYY